MKRHISAYVLVIALIISLFQGVPMVSAAEAPKLVASYDFNNQTLADSVGGNNAQLYDGSSPSVAVYTEGAYGKALQLSEKDGLKKLWLSIPYNVFSTCRDSFSISIWYCATDFNSSGEDSELLSFYNSSSEKFLFYSPAAVAFQDKGFIMKWDGTYGYANVMTSYQKNEWKHLVLCVNGTDGRSEITAYVNGSAVEVDQGGSWENSLMSTLGIDTFTIGGKNPYKGGSTPNCMFYGAVDEIQIYSGILDQSQAANIYAEIKAADASIFYRPLDGGTGDVTPIYYDGKYYLFFLHSLTHKWCYVTTTDFVNYSNVTVLEDFGGTGDVLNINGTWHLFASKSTNGTEVIHHYTGTSLDNLTDTGRNISAQSSYAYSSAWRDPRVWYDSSTGKYRMLVATWVKDGNSVGRDGGIVTMTSSDLYAWSYGGVYFSSGYFPGAYECPDTFQIGDWYYLVYSDCSYGKHTYYVKSQTPNGPWEIPERDAFDSLFFYAAKTVSDGRDRYLLGWAADRTENTLPLGDTAEMASLGYAGNMIVHRLQQQSNGDLICMPVETISAQFTEQTTNTFTPLNGAWSSGSNSAEVSSPDGFAAMLMQELPKRFLLQFTLKTDAKQAGIALNTDAGFSGKGAYLYLDQAYSRAASASGFLDLTAGSANPFAIEAENAISFEKNREYRITVICDSDVAVLYVEGECALTFRMTSKTQANLGLFCFGGTAAFSDLSLKRIPATKSAPKSVYADRSTGAVLLAEYNFDASNTADAVSGKDAVLYCNGTAADGVYTSGVSGNALCLSQQGSEDKYWLNIPITSISGVSDTMSLSMWYNSTGYNASGEDSELFSLYSSGAEKFLFYSPRGASYERPYVMKWDGTYGYANPNCDYTENAWTHLVFCIEAVNGESQISVYINGQAVDVDQGGAWANSLLSNLGIDTFTIGGENPYKGGTDPKCLFYGMVDEIRIYSGKLTQSDAAALFSGADPGKEYSIFLTLSEGAVSEIIPVWYNGLYYVFFEQQATGKLWWTTTGDFLRYSEVYVLGDYGHVGSILHAENGWHLFSSKMIDGGAEIAHYSGRSLFTLQDSGMHLRPDTQRYESSIWADPQVIAAPNGGYRMIVSAVCKNNGSYGRNAAIVKLSSDDLNTWTEEGTLYSPGRSSLPLESPDLFRIGEWYYLIYSDSTSGSRTRYVKSTSPDGPWIVPAMDELDSQFFFGGKTVWNGTSQYLIGRSGDRTENVLSMINTQTPLDFASVDYTGGLVVHKIVQLDNGDLTLEAPDQLADYFTGSVSNTFRTLTGTWSASGSQASVSSYNTFSSLLMQSMPERFLLTFTLETDAKQAGIGLNVDQSFAANGYYVFLDSDYGRLRKISGALAHEPGYYIPVASEQEAALPIGAGNTHRISVLVDGELAVIWVNGACAMTVRMKEESRRNLGLFCYDGTASFTEIQMKVPGTTQDTHTHVWTDDNPFTAPATATEPGVIVQLCTVCGEYQTTTTPVLELLAEYNFNDEDTTDSIGTNDATLYDNATAATAAFTNGVSGKALQLSAKDAAEKYWLDIPMETLAGLDSFTISMWYKQTGKNTSGEDSELFSFYNSSAEKFLYYTTATTGGGNGFTMKWDGNYGYANSYNLAYSENEWVHLTYVVDIENGLPAISVYKNGVLTGMDQGGNWSNGLLSELGVNKFTIGGKNPYKGGNTPNCLFYGAVDEVKLYAGALTAVEAEAIYRAEKPTIARGTLLAEYNFDNRDTTDCIGSNDATLYNNADAATAAFVNGVSGKALNLSAKGTNEKYWLSVPLVALAGLDSFTISMWYNQTGKNTSGEDSELFSFYNSNEERFLYYTTSTATGANNGFTMKWDGSYGYANSYGFPYTENEWIHLTYVVDIANDQAAISVYKNGELVGTEQGGDWSNGLLSELGVDKFTIGGKNPYKGGATPNCLFYGAVDEIKLYAGALTAEEANAIFEADKAKTPIVTANSISLKDEIGVNFYIWLPDGYTAENTEVSFAWGTGDSAHTAAGTLTATTSYDANYRVSCGIAARHMTDAVTMTVTSGGETILSDSFSVVQYAELAKATYAENADLMQLLCNMLDYGGAVQEFFGYQTNDLASSHIATINANWIRAERTVSLTDDTAIPNDTVFADYGLKYEYATMMATSKTAIRLYFSVTDATAFANTKATLGTEELNFITKGSYQYLEISGIAAKNIFNTYTIKLTNGTNTQNIPYNAANYYNAIMNQTSSAGDTYDVAKLQAVIAAMYQYYSSAGKVL